MLLDLVRVLAAGGRVVLVDDLVASLALCEALVLAGPGGELLVDAARDAAVDRGRLPALARLAEIVLVLTARTERRVSVSKRGG